MPHISSFAGSAYDDQNENVDHLDEYIVKNAPFSIKGLFGLSPSLLVFHNGKQVIFYQRNGYTINGISAKLVVNIEAYTQYGDYIESITGFLSNRQGVILQMKIGNALIETIHSSPIVSEIFPGIAYRLIGARDSIVSCEGNMIAQKVFVWNDSDVNSGIIQRFYFSKDSPSDQTALFMSLLLVLSSNGT
jgi:hypothetical protein